MATSRAAVGSLFAAVQASASTLTSAVTSLNDVVSMGNRAIEDASRRQALRSEADLATYEDMYLKDKAREVIQHEDDITAWLGTDKARTDRYNTVLNELRTKCSEANPK